MKYYASYGSNLSMEQMARRCPDAFPVATGVLSGYKLCFKGSGTGAYLTVEQDLDYSAPFAPVLIWAISEEDEKQLDRYEGCPTFYYKKTVTVNAKPLYMKAGQHKGRLIACKALVYIMHEDRQLGSPSNHYLDICMEGYRRFGFDQNILLEALAYSEDYWGISELDEQEDFGLPWEEVPPCVTDRKKKTRINWDQMELCAGGAE